MTHRSPAIASCLGLVCLPLAAAAQPLGDDNGVAAVKAHETVDRPLADDAGGASPDTLETAGRALEHDAGDAPLAAREIVDRALEQAARYRVTAFELGFEYFTDGWVESLDGDGLVTDAKTTRSRHYPLEGHFYSEVLLRDGEPLDDDDARDEQKKKADFLREVREHAARGERYDPDEMRVDFDRELMDRYVATLVGTDIVAGVDCWVIAFEPREGRLPNNRRLDGAMNRSSGRLWVGRHDYGVRRAEFEMQQPVRWLWGIAGTLRRASGEIDFRRIEAGLWIPDRTLVEIELGVFFGLKTIRRRMRNEWVDPPAAAELHADSTLP